MNTIKPKQTQTQIEQVGFNFLSKFIAIDSMSDSHSQTHPSTKGQEIMAQALVDTYHALGIKSEILHGSVIAQIRGKGRGLSAKPIVLSTHLDTAKGTKPLRQLNILRNWDGLQNVPYTHNKTLECNVKNFPSLKAFVNQDIIFGNGLHPFGLDDKLGLAESLTLAWLLIQNQDNTQLSYPTIFFLHRPDEEINSQKFVGEIAKYLKARGVEYGFTIDGMSPFEINPESLYAGMLSIDCPKRLTHKILKGYVLDVEIQGIVSHTFNAHEERLTPAIVFLCQTLNQVMISQIDILNLTLCGLKDLSYKMKIYFEKKKDLDAFVLGLQQSIIPHQKYGAGLSYQIQHINQSEMVDESINQLVFWLCALLPKIRLSKNAIGNQGFVNPIKIDTSKAKNNQLWIQVGYFEKEKLVGQVMFLIQEVLRHNFSFTYKPLFDNIKSHLHKCPKLINIPKQSAINLGFDPDVIPMRYSNGADQFLENGVILGNLGTGYFGAECPKELTSFQMLAKHSCWLFDICQRFKD